MMRVVLRIYTRHSTAEIACAITVAIAAPRTPSEKRVINTMSSAILSSDESTRKMSGINEFPIERSKPDKRLYSSSTTENIVIVEMYDSDSSRISCGVPNASKMERRHTRVNTNSTSEMASVIKSDSAATRLSRSRSPEPNTRADTMLNPVPNPMPKPMSKSLSDVQEPIAAKLCSPR